MVSILPPMSEDMILGLIWGVMLGSGITYYINWRSNNE